VTTLCWCLQKKDRRDRQDDGTLSGGDCEQHKDRDAGSGHAEERTPSDPEQSPLVHEDHQEGEWRHKPRGREDTHPTEGTRDH